MRKDYKSTTTAAPESCSWNPITHRPNSGSPADCTRTAVVVVDGRPLCDLCAALPEFLFCDSRIPTVHKPKYRCIACGEMLVDLSIGGTGCRQCDGLKPVDIVRGTYAKP